MGDGCQKAQRLSDMSDLALVRRLVMVRARWEVNLEVGRPGLVRVAVVLSQLNPT